MNPYRSQRFCVSSMLVRMVNGFQFIVVYRPAARSTQSGLPWFTISYALSQRTRPQTRACRSSLGEEQFGHLSRLGNGERNLPEAKARRAERAGASESIKVVLAPGFRDPSRPLRIAFVNGSKFAGQGEIHLGFDHDEPENSTRTLMLPAPIPPGLWLPPFCERQRAIHKAAELCRVDDLSFPRRIRVMVKAISILNNIS